MIYINRSAIAFPDFFQARSILERHQRLEAHYRNPEHLQKQTAPDDNSPNYLNDEEVLAKLTELFNNKCAFCESLLVSNTMSNNIKRFERSVLSGLKANGDIPTPEEEALKKYFDGLITRLHRRWEEETNDSIMGELFNSFDYGGLGEHSHAVVELFRPKNWATDLYGRSSFEHYWWLDAEWENIYLCCETCSSQKGNRFPVKGDRISYGQSVEDEDALLIDPCSKQDFEEEDISFKEEYAIPLTEYGEATIEILGLNRPALLKSRRMTLELAKKKIHAFLAGGSVDMYSTGKLFSDGQPYLGAIISNARLSFEPNEFDRLLDVMPFQEGMEGRKEKLKTNAKVHTKESLQQVSDDYYSKTRSYSLDELVNEEKMESEDRQAYFNSAKWIAKIEIENFKNIKSLTLDFPRNIVNNVLGEEPLQPWLVLLGENGVGKSSVLQAVAMTLMGQTRLDDFEFDAKEYVTRGTPQQSTVKVYLTDRLEPIVLTIDKAANTFKLNVTEPQIVLMGYGATRLLTKDKDRSFTTDFIRTKNLFDPFEQLDNVQDWLRDPAYVDDGLFEAIGESLSDLLMLKADKSDQRFFREQVNGKWQILFEKEKGEKVPLNYLSSGYKAVIALALDILVGLFQLYGEGDQRSRLQNAEGIALIDEIGVHLHPQWKMWIVGALRRTFPKMNFIVTTHEPLCLRGLEKGEVFVVNLDEKNGIKVETDLPSPKDLRIDQLLTSSYFGLNSVIDPEVERKFNRYYELQAMGAKLTPQQKKELDMLEPQVLERKIMLGSTMREEMEYKVIKEKFEHFSNKESKIKPEEVNKEIITELKEKWDDALFD